MPPLAWVILTGQGGTQLPLDSVVSAGGQTQVPSGCGIWLGGQQV
jgi:hypothetical protein